MRACASTAQWSGTGPVVDLLGRLRAAPDVRELFATAAELARRELPFDRAVVLSVGPGRLTAQDSGALADPASDRLRRRVLARPVGVPARTREAGLLGRGPAGGPSVLADALELRAPAFGAVAPCGAPLALLVVDRDAPAPDEGDTAAVRAFAEVLAVALEHLVLRLRSASVAAELRHLMASAQALLGELQHAPPALPSAATPGAVLTWEAVGGSHGELARLSAREREILDRLVLGRSNREIAQELVLAPDTVKGHVARILRKLGAANRVEAVSRYLSMPGGQAA
ncbi:MAG TPA: helix-turn-helix transcriptional regulator [Baekduia sp.]|nr:helix-turn-helix transcriptional regulator [Baekduia sp.]